MKNVLDGQEVFDRLSQISIELEEYNIKFQPWTMIKVQVIADFVAECTKQESTPMSVNYTMESKYEGTWRVFVNYSGKFKGSSIGVIIMDDKKLSMSIQSEFIFMWQI